MTRGPGLPTGPSLQGDIMNANDALERLSTIYERDLRPAEAVAEATSIYLELGAEIEELNLARASAKQVIADVFTELGTDKLETPAGTAYVSRPSIRISYDWRGLDKLGQERPDLANVLSLYRTEKEVAGSLTVRAPAASANA